MVVDNKPMLLVAQYPGANLLKTRASYPPHFKAIANYNIMHWLFISTDIIRSHHKLTGWYINKLATESRIGRHFLSWF